MPDIPHLLLFLKLQEGCKPCPESLMSSPSLTRKKEVKEEKERRKKTEK